MSELKGKYQARILDILNSQKLVRSSSLRTLLYCNKNASLHNAVTKLTELGLIEKHGDYLCLPGYDNLIPATKRRLGIKYTPKVSIDKDLFRVF